jgi:peptidoglycan-associated lipoprotein
MRVSRHLRFSFLAAMAFCFTLATTSCSKKDVMTNEPAINPSENAGASAPGGESVGTSGAGEAGVSDLEIVHFAFDRYDITPENRSILKQNAKWLKDNANATVQIEGHCDERGTTEYNLALGERRANAVKSYLIKLGIKKARLSTISYGSERPVDPGHDEAAWAKNRRAAFVLLSK